MTTDTKAVARWDVRWGIPVEEEKGGDYVLFSDHEQVVSELVELAEVLNDLAVSKEEFPVWPDGWDWGRIDSTIRRFKGNK